MAILEHIDQLLRQWQPAALVEVSSGVRWGGGAVLAELPQANYRLLQVDPDIKATDGQKASGDEEFWGRVSPDGLPLEDSSCDVVVSCLSLHHVSDPELLVREMERVTRPGGRVLVVDTVAAEDAATAIAENDLQAARDVSHVRSLPVSELCRLLGLQTLRLDSVMVDTELIMVRGSEPYRCRAALLVATRQPL